MGLLTTITFRNDAYSAFKDHTKELVEGILGALRGDQLHEGRDYFSVGNDCNPVIIQKTRHADDTTLYLQYGGTVTDVHSIDETNEWAIEAAISEMEYHLERLKKFKKSQKK